MENNGSILQKKMLEKNIEQRKKAIKKKIDNNGLLQFKKWPKKLEITEMMYPYPDPHKYIKTINHSRHILQYNSEQ